MDVWNIISIRKTSSVEPTNKLAQQRKCFWLIYSQVFFVWLEPFWCIEFDYMVSSVSCMGGGGFFFRFHTENLWKWKSLNRCKRARDSFIFRFSSAHAHAHRFEASSTKFRSVHSSMLRTSSAQDSASPFERNDGKRRNSTTKHNHFRLSTESFWGFGNSRRRVTQFHGHEHSNVKFSRESICSIHFCVEHKKVEMIKSHKMENKCVDKCMHTQGFLFAFCFHHWRW